VEEEDKEELEQYLPNITERPPRRSPIFTFKDISSKPIDSPSNNMTHRRYLGDFTSLASEVSNSIRAARAVSA